MDTFNNRRGRSLASKDPCKSCTEKCLDAMKNGLLNTWLKGAGRRIGLFAPNDHQAW